MMDSIKLNSERTEYANEWARSSEKFFSDGDYAWMSSFITQKGFVLELGVGVGYSTLQLLKDGHKVIGVDENPKCLDFAERLLKENGYNAIRIKREKIIFDKSYTIEYDNININPQEFDVILIEGDFLHRDDFEFFDENLVNWLKKFSITTVVCWLIGSHSGRIFNKNLQDYALRFTTTTAYRIQSQNSAYELADMILDVGGVLQLVDRAPAFDEKAFIAHHKEQASVTSLEVSRGDSRAFKPASDGVKYTVDSKTELRSTDDEMYLVSALSVKTNTDR